MKGFKLYDVEKIREELLSFIKNPHLDKDLLGMLYEIAFTESGIITTIYDEDFDQFLVLDSLDKDFNREDLEQFLLELEEEENDETDKV